jgi:hypothetical protein
MERMSTLTASPEYIELLKKFPPRVIRTEKENEACTELLFGFLEWAAYDSTDRRAAPTKAM